MAKVLFLSFLCVLAAGFLSSLEAVKINDGSSPPPFWIQPKKSEVKVTRVISGSVPNAAGTVASPAVAGGNYVFKRTNTVQSVVLRQPTTIRRVEIVKQGSGTGAANLDILAGDTMIGGIVPTLGGNAQQVIKVVKVQKATGNLVPTLQNGVTGNFGARVTKVVAIEGGNVNVVPTLQAAGVAQGYNFGGRAIGNLQDGVAGLGLAYGVRDTESLQKIKNTLSNMQAGVGGNVVSVNGVNGNLVSTLEALRGAPGSGFADSLTEIANAARLNGNIAPAIQSGSAGNTFGGRLTEITSVDGLRGNLGSALPTGAQGGSFNGRVTEVTRVERLNANLAPTFNAGAQGNGFNGRINEAATLNGLTGNLGSTYQGGARGNGFGESVTETGTLNANLAPTGAQGNRFIGSVTEIARVDGQNGNFAPTLNGGSQNGNFGGSVTDFTAVNKMKGNLNSPLQAGVNGNRFNGFDKTADSSRVNAAKGNKFLTLNGGVEEEGNRPAERDAEVDIPPAIVPNGEGSTDVGAEGHWHHRPYKFHYTAPNHKSWVHRKEEKDADGTVRGFYKIELGNGLYRIVNYIADKHGFRTAIRSNEPGIGGGADIVLEAEQPPRDLTLRNLEERENRPSL